MENLAERIQPKSKVTMFIKSYLEGAANNIEVNSKIIN